MNKQKFGLTAAQLRILALLLMLLDHMYRTILPGQVWLTVLGRMAFPIFAFQCAEGCRHTRNFRKYCLRLLVFGVVSEIPFDLMLSGAPVYLEHQNVMFTLLLGLLACRAVDLGKTWLLIPIFLAAELGLLDYGCLGVLTVLAFHVFREQPLVQLLCLAGINCLGYGFFTVQSFAVLAWLPIIAYNGKRGKGGKALQYGSYLFYPLHMLILGLL